jgi:pimeloyl-ACP methyl ester carboxylesterase
MELNLSNNIHFYTEGKGTPLYLIHGFPDCAENFEHQINFFAERGFKVIVPYLPGYHEKDQVLDTYQTLRIAEVLIDFIESVSGEEKIFLYGHDWGAPITYGIAQLRPDLINKFSCASVPHGISVQTAFLTNGDQQRMSWYMFFFQLPIADVSVPLNDYEFIHRLWREWSPDLKKYKDYSDRVVSVLEKPNVLSKALAYYRSTFQETLQLERINAKALELLSTKIQPPCMYFHGRNDGCIDYQLADGMEEYFESLEIKIMEDCGHFLHIEKTDEFNTTLLNFFTDS